jgi:hypothetical protein
MNYNVMNLISNQQCLFDRLRDIIEYLGPLMNNTKTKIYKRLR